MRNKHPGICYRCGKKVEVGDGHFEKIKGTAHQWRVQHASCAIIHRNRKLLEMSSKDIDKKTMQVVNDNFNELI